MLDFTKEIGLDNESKRKYSYLRSFVFLLFFLTGLFVVHKILFPSAYFELSFDSQGKKTITDPRRTDESLHENGTIHASDGFVFNTGLSGIFSDSKTRIDLTEGSFNKKNDFMKARKSYMAFFYHKGNPLSFKEGALLKKGFEYFIVSDGKLRKFSSENVFSEMGFSKEAFLETGPEDLSFNPAGENISQDAAYPNGTLFHISEEYFQLKNGELTRFVSETAYLTQHERQQAIEKDLSFLNDYKVPEEFIGFRDGALVSTVEAVFVVNGKSLSAVESPKTFEAMGYSWNDVIPANSEEIGIYENGDLFTMGSAHPNGTIFKTKETGKYYYIQNKKKREIASPKVLQTYLKSSPVLAEEKSLETYASCEIKRRFALFGWYVCEMPLKEIEILTGNNYQFEMEVESRIRIETLDTNFSRSISFENMKNSLSVLKGRILDNYISQ